MRHDYFPTSPSVYAQTDALDKAHSLAERGGFDQGRLDRVTEMLNRAWDISPRLSIARFELDFPKGEDDPSTVHQLMRRYFLTLSKVIQRRDSECAMTIGGGPTRLWGLWSADLPGRGMHSRLRVACLLDRDVCLTWQSFGMTWQTVLATTLKAAYGIVCGNLPQIPDLADQLGSDWLQSVDGYGDFAGFKAVFQQLSELCRSPDCAFGCGLVPNRVVDVELYPLDSFIFPPSINCSERKAVSVGTRGIGKEPEQNSCPRRSALTEFDIHPCPGLVGIGRGKQGIFCQTN